MIKKGRGNVGKYVVTTALTHSDEASTCHNLINPY